MPLVGDVTAESAARKSGPGEFFFWTHFRLSLWREVLLRMRSVNRRGNV